MTAPAQIPLATALADMPYPGEGPLMDMRRAGRARPCERAWKSILDGLEHAFQPIVHVRTGRCHGFEALLRGIDPTMFSSVPAMLDDAHADGVLPMVEAELHAKAVAKYCSLDGWREAKLFLNIDARVVGGAQAVSPVLLPGPKELSIVHEISEHKEVRDAVDMEDITATYRKHQVGLALDDFGVGFAGLKLLYKIKPDYLKIDRFFVQDIHRDLGKRAIVNHLVGYAHTLGILTIAEGVETEAEFYTCRDIGCDFMQGYLIARPALDLPRLPLRMATVETLNARDRRQPPEVRQRLAEVIERIPPVCADEPKSIIFDYFRDGQNPPIAPVVDKHGLPLGLLRERDLKQYVYSKYGRDLLNNKGHSKTLVDLLAKCPVCDINTPLDRVIEAFSEETAEDGVIIIESGEYAGFLTSRALIGLVHEKNLAMATDQNPLTRLPGNAAIIRHIEEALDDRDAAHTLVYFDFDWFKPFNDTFGFRQGDRAIQMFGERLKVLASACGGFAGHIGGDDFFLGVGGQTGAEMRRRVQDLAATFRSDAESLYDAASRAAGHITAKDRFGTVRRFPLLSVSGVAVTIPAGEHGVTLDAITDAIAAHKPTAKGSPDKVCFVTLDDI
ncbi:MAG TPA: GGDEF domain-containing protein [Azospirillum sp.]